MDLHRTATAALLAAAALMLAGCNGESGSTDQPRDRRVIDTPDGLEENPGFLSPPTLQRPLYACASSVVVRDFIVGAKIEVFLQGDPNPIGALESFIPGGQNIDTSHTFSEGDVVFARQTFDGATSGDSNRVTVTSHVADYPSGLPAPRLRDAAVLNCGRAIGIEGAVPGARVTLFTDEPDGSGGFNPETAIGSVSDFPYITTSSAFNTNWRVRANQKLCTATSGFSARKTVAPEPSSLPGPIVRPLHEGVDIAVVAVEGGELAPGATLDVFADDQPPGSERVGGQATPGPNNQQVRISPPAGGSANFTAAQTLCSTTGTSPTPTPVLPCSDLSAPIIRAPMPGDTRVEIIESVLGAEILVFANGVEIGHSGGGGSFVNLSRAIAEGEVITVIQRIEGCTSGTAFQVPATCNEATGGSAQACRGDWPAFGQSGLRARVQRANSVIGDPLQVRKLQVKATFAPSDGHQRGFRGASPIVHNDTVYIGSSAGFMYALRADNLAQKWLYPDTNGDGVADSSDALFGRFLSNSSSYGIAASAAIGRANNERDVVIFGAPDQSIGTNLGSGRLFALREDGTEEWKSPEIAIQRCAPGETGVDCLTRRDNTELHEQIGYSAPLVHRDRVYIGIADHGDNPIQNGQVKSVNLGSGAIDGGFSFVATTGRGGGVWTSAAGGLSGDAVYITTGNTNCALNGGFPECSTEPSVNHGLSMIRLNRTTGAVEWKFQPVPFELDEDPDWATGTSLARASCGDVVASTMKDGFTYSANAAGGAGTTASIRWQFPRAGFPFTDDTYEHGDTRYLFPGAIWRDTFYTTTGGYDVLQRDVDAGFNRIHALNVCGPASDPVRWVAEVPGVSARGYALGPISVTNGIVFVGTTDGRLVAFADPAVWPSANQICSHPGFPVADCAANGYAVKTAPLLLLDIDLDPSSTAEVLGEPVIANGRVYVATGRGSGGGRVYMLEPGEE